MVERRSMNQALALTPEKLAFIHGAPGTANANGETKTDALEPAVTRESPDTVSIVTMAATSKSLSEHAPLGDVPPVLVPLTTRLLPATAEALRRAYLQQKLRRVTPSTQQEIVEEALSVWLQSRGFLGQ